MYDEDCFFLPTFFNYSAEVVFLIDLKDYIVRCICLGTTYWESVSLINIWGPGLYVTFREQPESHPLQAFGAGEDWL